VGSIENVKNGVERGRAAEVFFLFGLAGKVGDRAVDGEGECE